MAVPRYRSPYDMPPPGRAKDADLAARIRSVWQRAFLLCPPARHRGVRRFRSLVEANQERLAETVARMRRAAGFGQA